jgi:hypothetical protein
MPASGTTALLVSWWHALQQQRINGRQPPSSVCGRRRESPAIRNNPNDIADSRLTCRLPVDATLSRRSVGHLRMLRLFLSLETKGAVPRILVGAHVCATRRLRTPLPLITSTVLVRTLA